MKEVIQTQNAPAPLGPYSQAIKAGNFLFVSGQVAIDPEKGKIIAEGIRAQTVRVLENIRAILEAAGYEFSDIIQTSVSQSTLAFGSSFKIASKTLSEI